MARKITTIFLLLTLLLYSIVLFRTAWFCDDACITYRVVYNFVNGYGLRWNPAERVQAYTHPLWMFLHAGLYFLTQEIYFTFIFIPIITSLITMLLFAFFIASSPVSAILGVAILTFSKAFMDYSTSGLENPMTHLILALFFIIYFRHAGARDHIHLEKKGHAVPEGEACLAPTSANHIGSKFHIGSRELFLLGLISAFAATNRMDTILLYIPPLIYFLLKFRPFKKGLYLLTAGFIPFILWEIFSLFYYGFLFPNTAYAKLNTGISEILLIKHGFRYLSECFTFDPITLTIIGISLLIPFIKREKGYMPIALGILLYLAYIVGIGGDFMLGRYLTAPLFLAVLLITRLSFMTVSKSWFAMIIFVLFTAFMTPYPTLLTNENYGWNNPLKNILYKITDSRQLFYKFTGLLRVVNGRIQKPYQKFYFNKKPTFTIAAGIGHIGLSSGPHAHIIDALALADPLLARLDAIYKEDFWIGHFPREIPTGYVKSLRTGKNMIKNGNIAAFYDKISLITRGDLFDWNRLAAIWNMNTGRYDNLIENVIVPTPMRRIPLLKPPKSILKPVNGSKQGGVKSP